MRRVPILPTLLVAAAVAILVMLGMWQLERAALKDQWSATARANMALPEIELRPGAVLDDSLRFRRARAVCEEVVEWRRTGGRSADGAGGTRFIATCRAQGGGLLAFDMGVSPDPRVAPRWEGGPVSGRIAAEPPRAGLWTRLTGRAPPPEPMIVSETAAGGLRPSAQPSGEIENTSRVYALQWFSFALIALAIYGLALRRRLSGGGRAPTSPAS
jgi:surfeit locus 1 family protein